MNTEAMEEFSASNDHMIVKGKRTKRPRHSSSASSSGGGADLNSNSSPTTSSGISTSTEEDEDLANCLILLARGRRKEPAESKFSSRKSPAVDGKAGVYVYECKTCSRTFSSFQALGGHRASHKKPKSAVDFDQKPPNYEEEEEEEEEEEAKFVNTITPPPSNKPKIHECSICGAEFASGQALGGHMRRHRSTAAAAAKTDDDSNSIHHDHHHHHHQIVEKARNMLSLDLNLPAPPEEDFHAAFSTSQQPRLVFTAAAF